MKKILSSVAMAFSMFSIIPMPRMAWKQENMRYMLGALPLVGVVTALVLQGWLLLKTALDMGIVLFAVGLTLLPLLVSGGIHMDGFCDTVDALASHAPAGKKRAILKDPHTGAFAVLAVAGYLLLYFGLCTELTPDPQTLLLLGCTLVTSRTAGALAGVLFPFSGEAGLLQSFHQAAAGGTAAVLLGWAVLCGAVMVLLAPLRGLVMMAAAVVCFFAMKRTVKRQFCGMSGDLAGYLIQITELVLLVVLTVTGKVGLV